MKKYYQYILQITYLCFFALAAFAVRTLDAAIPDQIYTVRGESVSYEFGVPVSVVLKEDDAAEVFEAASGGLQKDEKISGSYTVTCRLFGLFPVKDVEVMLVRTEQVYAGGTPVGIYARTDGVLVIGTGTVTDGAGKEVCPAEHLVKGGDYIVSVNGEAVSGKEELIEKINAFGGSKEVLGIRRNEEYIEVSIEPAKNSSGESMLGIWVRDDLAGVGTLTYYRKNGEFGALGHAVSDADTGVLMEMSEGWIYEAEIVDIKKGTRGVPGELSGMIDYNLECCLGIITENSAVGIHGKLGTKAQNLFGGKEYEVAYKQEIRTGAAYLISSVAGKSEMYEINIESLDYSGVQENKGIMFRVTDRRLLSMTGGIVQGMFTSYNGSNNRKASKIKGFLMF